KTHRPYHSLSFIWINCTALHLTLTERFCPSSGVNVKTGHVFPASFTCRGPAEELRSARTFSGAQMVDVYDSSRELVKIDPCRWTPNMAFWLSQDDETILQYLSTSPHAEPPHFVHHIKSTIQFLLDHPTADGLFPHLYRRAEDGRWKRA
uniref:Uncharacterized protein n=1 Tax=Sinocyclocheilus rhinocerous TaxID=307959 RepID=A0A673MA88_9TELE